MKHRTLKLATLLLVATAAFVCPRFAASAAGEKADPAQRRAPGVDYAKFTHDIPQHQKDCGSCHKTPSENWQQARAKDDAYPDITDYPEHASCLECHRRQFFSGARPAICAVCHTVVSPRSGERFPFENPIEAFARSPKAARHTEFAINFPHDRHQDVMARVVPPFANSKGFQFVRASFGPPAQTTTQAQTTAQAQAATQAQATPIDNCSLCHKTYEPQGDSTEEYVTKPAADLPTNALGIAAFWLKKGMLKTTPSSHASCFNCHYQDGGEKPYSSDCAGCHQLTPSLPRASRGAAPVPNTPPRDADLSNPSVKGITDPDVLADFAQRRVARFKHEVYDHMNKVSCTSCHVTITAVSKINADTLYVPIQACAPCHTGTKAPKNIVFQEIEQRKKPDGANFVCAKCHVNYGKLPTPKSHSDLFVK
jgi:cytochrome c556